MTHLSPSSFDVQLLVPSVSLSVCLSHCVPSQNKHGEIKVPQVGGLRISVVLFDFIWIHSAIYQCLNGPAGALSPRKFLETVDHRYGWHWLPFPSSSPHVSYWWLHSELSERHFYVLQMFLVTLQVIFLL